jgi:predicted Zn-dependent protease
LLHAGAVIAALLLAACTASPPPVGPQAATTPGPAKTADSEMPPAVLREHQRILASYGGVYNDPKLQTMLEQTVDRLVAASEKPDQHYKVTMLNSQSINAFALPTGQIYVTRGLIALANDESELASVLAHEMGHVIARHADGKIQNQIGELLPRAGIGSRRARHRNRGARRLRSLWRGALPLLDGA